MTELLTTAAISGAGIAYVIEVLDLLIYPWVSKGEAKRFLIPLLAVGADWLLGVHDWSLAVSAPATAFIALAMLQWSDRPSVFLRMPGSSKGLM